jgi:hypothetical protein
MIKVGDKFKCIKDVRHFYTKGKTYICEEVGCLTDNNGDQYHGWSGVDHPTDEFSLSKNFEKVVEASNINYAADASLPQPNYVITTSCCGGECCKTEPTTADLIIAEVEDIKNTLLDKNRRYGDSATTPGEIFGLSPVVAIKARIEDKVRRLKNVSEDESEDVTKDLIGYLILLRIAQKNEL